MIAVFLTSWLIAPVVVPSALPQTSASPPAISFVDLAIPARRDYAFDEQGVLYITAGSVIERYDTHSGTQLAPFAIGGSLVGIDVSPDGSTLAVADASVQGDDNRVQLVDTSTGVATPVSFQRVSLETGTFMVAWGRDARLLVTSSFGGSGWVPLRRYDPADGTTEVLGTVRQNTMLTPSADRRTIAIAESNISSGPVRVYNVNQGAIVASTNTDWFMFEVAVSSTGRYLLAPSYGGAHIYGRRGGTLVPLGTIGEYATWGPIGAVFSPTSDVVLTADWGTEPGLKAYSLETMQSLGTLDPYPFPWTGNHALGPGRMEVSPDRRWLAVSIVDAVRVYRL